MEKRNWHCVSLDLTVTQNIQFRFLFGQKKMVRALHQSPKRSHGQRANDSSQTQERHIFIFQIFPLKFIGVPLSGKWAYMLKTYSHCNSVAAVFHILWLSICSCGIDGEYDGEFQEELYKVKKVQIKFSSPQSERKGQAQVHLSLIFTSSSQ